MIADGAHDDVVKCLRR